MVTKVNISSIDATYILMNNDCDEIVKMLNNYINKIDKTKEMYDTESAFLFREISMAYIEYVLKYVNNTVRPYINKLTDISKTYNDEYNQIMVNIGGGQNE